MCIYCIYKYTQYTQINLDKTQAAEAAKAKENMRLGGHSKIIGKMVVLFTWHP